MPHLPGLDGLRGLAVIGVLLFHGGFAWAQGGFLGVSTFFTLSGFLITNILVREWDGRGSIDLGRFWGRRFRRLMPAAIVTIALIGLVWWRVGSPEQLADMRGDMLASLFYVANWRFVAADTSYASLFTDPTPLQHFWSLAIEEQFYVVFPLVVVLCMRLGGPRTGRRVLATVCALVAAVSVTLGFVLSDSFDRVYYGTDTRVAELLFGVLLALWWSGRERSRPDGLEWGRWTDRFLALCGLAALVAMFAAWTLVPEASTALGRGGFALYAAGTVIIILAVTRSGAVAALLSMSWLRGVGLISYGLYLYHWPIFLLVDEERTGLETAPLFVVRMAITTVAALLSYRLLEMPIRRGTLFPGTGRARIAAAVGSMAVVVIAVSVTLSPPALIYARGEVGEIGYEADTDSDTTVRSPEIDTVLLLGDSGAMDASPAWSAALRAAGARSVIRGAGMGFGLTVGFPWREDWANVVASDDPRLVIMMMGGWDGKFIEENGVDAYLRVVDEAVTILSARGARILWLPAMIGGVNDLSEMNEAYRRISERWPGVVWWVPTDAALTTPFGTVARSYIEDGRLIRLRKRDGWHLCQDGAGRIAQVVLAETQRNGWIETEVRPWYDGEWQNDPVFDDPPGVCDPQDFE